GLSHAERQIVANVVKFNTAPFEYYDELVQDSSVSREEYLVIAKLTAILRTANSLDRSHRQRIQDIKVSIRDGKLIITALTDEDLTLEQGTLAMEDSLFEEVFNLRTVLHQKRRV
ncbi:MAG TPA: exopolyphosphatase, partial [Lachnospiraceae bacterium]|nr:exopolyphosphatase [Lachnospiraceae bacterium]